MSLPPKEGRELLDHIKDKETSLLNQDRLSVTINASASSVETGETIWFYEWTHAEARGDDETVQVLAVCDNGKCRVTPRQDQKDQEKDPFISGSTEAVSKQKSVQDKQNATYHKLLRELVTNLAHSFKHPSTDSFNRSQNPQK